MASHLLAALLSLANNGGTHIELKNRGWDAIPAASNASDPGYEQLHRLVHDSILQTYNGRPAHNLVDLADLIEDGGTLCFPAPFCISGHDQIKSFLQHMQGNTTDTYMIPSSPDGNIVFNEHYGQLHAAAVAYKLRGSDDDGCQVQGTEFWTWQFPTGHTNMNSSTGKLKLASLSVFFDEAARLQQLSACEKRISLPKVHPKISSKHLRGTRIISSTRNNNSTSSLSSSVLAVGSSDASKHVQGMIRGTLEAHFHKTVATTALRTTDPRWIEGWVKPFSGAQDQAGEGKGNQSMVPALCDGFPLGCLQTTEDVRKHFESYIPATTYGSVSLVSPIWVAGNVGSALAMYMHTSNKDELDGCFEYAHLQLITMELDPKLVASFAEDEQRNPEAPVDPVSYPSSGGLLTMNTMWSMKDAASERHECNAK